MSDMCAHSLCTLSCGSLLGNSLDGLVQLAFVIVIVIVHLSRQSGRKNIFDRFFRDLSQRFRSQSLTTFRTENKQESHDQMGPAACTRPQAQSAGGVRQST